MSKYWLTIYQIGERSSNQSNYGVNDFDLRLHRSNHLLDDNFVYIKRDENQTKLIDDYDRLADKYSNCFYRNENSAIDLCDGYVVSIVYFIQFLFFFSLMNSLLFY